MSLGGLYSLFKIMVPRLHRDGIWRTERLCSVFVPRIVFPCLELYAHQIAEYTTRFVRPDPRYYDLGWATMFDVKDDDYSKLIGWI
jgi:hypothetical protein